MPIQSKPDRAPADGRMRALARERGAAEALVVCADAMYVADALAHRGPARLVRPLSEAPVRCEDLRALGAQARAEGWALLVDATDCGVGGCAAERLGAHASVVALDAGCCLLGLSRDAGSMLLDVAAWAANLPREDDLDAALRRIEAGRRAWHAASDEAQVVAAYLRCHPRVRDLRYPGLKQDPSYAVAARTLQGGFGPFVDYRLDGSDAWLRLRCAAADPRDTVLALERAL